MRIEKHHIILSILIIYTAVILFFLFFGVGRPGAAVDNHEYQFNFIPNITSFSFPTFSDLKYFPHGFFELGNFLGFIPFGIFIPMIFRCKFTKFISIFILLILLIETIQMLTFLGRFDINDIIMNSLGAVVGFSAYKIGSHFTKKWKIFIITIISAVFFSIGVIGFSKLLNKSFTKIEGPVIALNELDHTINKSVNKNLQSFEIRHEKIEPEINLYESEGYEIKAFTYTFNGKSIVLSLNYGIPDNASDYEGISIISVDGKEVDIFSNRDHGSSEVILDKINELTITIKGNMKLWDVTFKEMQYKWE